MLLKIIFSGDWNMDSNPSLAVAHGLAYKKIRSVSVIVRNNDDDGYYDLAQFDGTTGWCEGGITSIDVTNITLARRGTGFFDHTVFDSTTYNRAWITVMYEE